MSKLTLDEAIKHCLEVAENCEEQAKQCDSDDRYERHVMHENAKCAADHRQLAEWLTELKELRSLKTDYVFFKAEAAKLLELAVEDFAVYGALKDLSAEQRVQNSDWQRFNRVFDILDRRWRYADEALALIGRKGDTNN